MARDRGGCSAVLRANGRRRAKRARSSSVCVSGRGRGRMASATWARARASRASGLASCPVALATSRAWRGGDDHDGQTRRRQRSHHGPLVASVA